MYEPLTQKCRDNNTVNNTINNKYIDILKLWNEQEIMKCISMTEKLFKLITVKIKDYSLELIKDAIENYGEIYHSKFYFNHPWSLFTFLKQGNAMPHFFSDEKIRGEKWSAYIQWCNSPEQQKLRGKE